MPPINSCRAGGTRQIHRGPLDAYPVLGQYCKVKSTSALQVPSLIPKPATVPCIPNSYHRVYRTLSFVTIPLVWETYAIQVATPLPQILGGEGGKFRLCPAEQTLAHYTNTVHKKKRPPSDIRATSRGISQDGTDPHARWVRR